MNLKRSSHLFTQKFCPSSIVVKMPDDDHDVGVAGLADRLSVVQGLDDRDQATVLLDVAGQAVQVAGSLVAAQLAPRVVSCPGSFDS